MLTAKLILDRLDKEGRLLERKEQKSRSFTKGLIQLLYVAHAQITDASPYSMTEYGGAAKNVDSAIPGSTNYTRENKCTLKVGGGPGNSENILLPGKSFLANNSIGLNDVSKEGQYIGIQVGTGTNAVTPTDTALQTRIAHGKTAGLLEYGGCELVGISIVNPNGEFTIRRYFTNNSGGSITVNEVGMHAAGSWGHYLNGYSNLFLIARDLVSPGVAVANTEILRVTYVPQITV